MNKIWCPLPWGHISINNDGNFRLCSHSSATISQNNIELNITDVKNINEILNSDLHKKVRKTFMNNKWPLECIRCEMDNKSNNKKSRNLWEIDNHTIINNSKINDITQNDGTLTQFITETLDMRMGNVCNLSCLMCSPTESSRWAAIFDDVFKIKTHPYKGKLVNLPDLHKKFRWSFDEKYLDFMLLHAQFIKKITFGGGEPLLLKSIDNFLNKLVECGLSKNIELEYSTNLTVDIEQKNKLWSNFKKIKLCCSIDGTEKYNTFVRNQSNWDTIVYNLHKIDKSNKNIEAFTSSTYSILNLSNLVDFSKWILNQKFKKINKNYNCLGATHPVYQPKFLSISIIDESIFNDTIDNMYHDTINKDIIKRIKYYQEFYQKTKNNELLLKKSFTNFYHSISNSNKLTFYEDELTSNLYRKWLNIF